jgi:NitT/TauT family transport system permease protein
VNRSILTFAFGRVLPPLLVFVLVTGGLQLAIQCLHVSPFILPLPTDVGRALITHRADLLAATWTTALASLIGFGSSVVIGVVVAITLSSSRWIRRAIYPYTLFFQTVPIVAIAPMLVLWFDGGMVSVSICAFIVSVFPVIANTLAGLLGTDPALLDLFQLYGAGPMDQLIKLRLPYALPSIVTGLRVAAGLAVIGTVVGEFLVGVLGDGEGLGVKIVGAKKYGHLDVVFAAVLLASLLGLALFAAVNAFGYLMLRRWYVSERSN